MDKLERKRKWYKDNRERARQYGRAYYASNTERYKEHHRENKARNKAIIDEAKGRPCADCGKTYPPWVMHFDHLPGVNKFHPIAHMITHSPARLRAEMEKCEVVCANCHANRTHLRKHPSCGA